MTWGQWASAAEHRRYMQPIKRRGKCWCCKQRITHGGFANGIILVDGCELLVRRWLKDASLPRRSAARGVTT
ncbi:hypothetical protein ABIF70_002155 [Bradyrhizobium japonicum]